MPSKTRSARLQRRKSKKQARSQSGGHGGFPISNSKQKYWDGYYLYTDKFKERELARRAAFKGPPGFGDPCVPLIGPRSQCKDYPKLKCSKPDYTKPTDKHYSKGEEYESRCMDGVTIPDPNYEVSHFYEPRLFAQVPGLLHELETRGY